MNPAIGTFYQLKKIVRLMYEPTMTVWTWDGKQWNGGKQMYDDIIPPTSFMVIGNFTDVDDHQWVCVIIADGNVGWFNRVHFNTGMDLFERLT